MAPKFKLGELVPLCFTGLVSGGFLAAAGVAEEEPMQALCVGMAFVFGICGLVLSLAYRGCQVYLKYRDQNAEKKKLETEVEEELKEEVSRGFQEVLRATTENVLQLGQNRSNNESTAVSSSSEKSD